MARITPGALCWIRCCDTPEWIGRIVTAVRPAMSQFVDQWGNIRSSAGHWIVEAPWLPPTYGGAECWLIRASSLVPITDPDADLSQPAADALHEDLVSRLCFTRTEAAQA